MIDPFHLEAYGETTINYNRDVEVFPVLQAMFEKIMGECPYKSPTDMGVNMAGNCIVDDEVCKEAARQEIIRRYYKSMEALVRGTGREEEVYKIELLLKQAHVSKEDRKVLLPHYSVRKKPVLLLPPWNSMTDALSQERLPTCLAHPLPDPECTERTCRN